MMPVNQSEKLQQHWHFVDNMDSNNESNKIFKIRLIIDAVRNEHTEHGELKSVDEEIILCKSKRRRIRQYNPKKPK